MNALFSKLLLTVFLKRSNYNFMKIKFLYVLFFFLLSACVDRLNMEVGAGASPVVVEGYISDQPGPYRIEISKAIEIDSKLEVKNRISVRRLSISDNLGTTEDLTEIEQGIYQTKTNGIRGEVGKAYTMRVELLDGRIYESIPDTIRASSGMKDTYFNFTEQVVDDASQYGFDVFFDSYIDDNKDYYYLWKMIGTYQIDTTPELHVESCGEATCPRPRPCSGFVLEGNALRQIAPCECCTCWVTLDESLPVLSDKQFVSGGTFDKVKIGYVPLDSWIFMHRVHVRVNQLRLSRQAFAFWKAVMAQKSATTSLFQPISGRIPSNFKQVGGKQGTIEGIFYAVGIDYKTVFINRLDVPNQGLLKDPELKFNENCVNYGNATTVQPSFWN